MSKKSSLLETLYEHPGNSISSVILLFKNLNSSVITSICQEATGTWQ